VSGAQGHASTLRYFEMHTVDPLYPSDLPPVAAIVAAGSVERARMRPTSTRRPSLRAVRFRVMVTWTCPTAGGCAARPSVVNCPRGLVAALLGVVLLLLAPRALAAQPLVRVVGQIQWIAAERMQVVTEGGESIAVDLTEADQSSYRGLRNGDWVVIDGVISSDRRRIIAQEIWRDSGRGYWSQSP
jgi:hypothetical protein